MYGWRDSEKSREIRLGQLVFWKEFQTGTFHKSLQCYYDTHLLSQYDLPCTELSYSEHGGTNSIWKNNIHSCKRMQVP